MLANAAFDRRRQLRRRPEMPLDPDAPAATNEVDQVTERAVLMRALADLPPRQRAVLVRRNSPELILPTGG
jgi:DNA-directed RNA polymerase specialized sigma24 family protein